MLNIEKPLDFDNINKDNNKKYYLSTIRQLTSQGNYFSLIKFIDNSIPNVSIFYY